ncbi:hypothetical protein [Acinetobacter johnsonii]|jgi:hypothetical protein|uniref:hypothetical protein n=1 Tax=Acinetobacter johnsonii TaxID=40214 RepID=UPI001F2050CB|nr:hypothetical protein [Acinetobacter johnsonii]
MLKTLTLIGACVAMVCCYKSYKKDPQKSKCKNLVKCDNSSKGGDETPVEQTPT